MRDCGDEEGEGEGGENEKSRALVYDLFTG